MSQSKVISVYVDNAIFQLNLVQTHGNQKLADIFKIMIGFRQKRTYQNETSLN